MAELNVKFYFAFQFIWFLIAWSVIAVFFIEPKLKEKDLYYRLSFWTAFHLFRVLGVGLLVRNLSPGMPKDFAVFTAAGDTLTAFLALCSLLALRHRWRYCIALVWIFNIFGFLDLMFALFNAVRVNASEYLQAQWYVPALVVPLMLVAHIAIFKNLIDQRKLRRTE